MNHQTFASPARISKRVWMLVFSHSSPTLSLACLRNVGGFILDECSTATDEQHRFLFLHFSLYAEVMQRDLESFVRRIQTERHLSSVYCVSVVSTDNESDKNPHPGVRYMMSLLRKNNRLLLTWRRAGCPSILRSGYRINTSSTDEIRHNASRDLLPVLSYSPRVSRIPEPAVVGMRRPRIEDSPLPIHTHKRRVIDDAARTRPASQPLPTHSPIRAPHPAHYSVQQQRPAPLRIPVQQSSLPSRPYQYVERANDHRWTAGWAM